VSGKSRRLDEREPKDSRKILRLTDLAPQIGAKIAQGGGVQGGAKEGNKNRGVSREKIEAPPPSSIKRELESLELLEEGGIIQGKGKKNPVPINNGKHDHDASRKRTCQGVPSAQEKSFHKKKT